MQQRKGFFARLANLWSGFWGTKLSDAEAKNAELVYHNALRERVHQQEKLKDAVGRLVYLRNRIEADLKRLEEDQRLVEEALLRAAHDDDDARALGLIRKKRQLETELTRLGQEHTRLSAQADSAKQGLGEHAKAIKQLKGEREEMLARKQHAIARLQVASALQQSTGDFTASDQALENVREAIVRLEHSADMDVEPVDTAPGDVSLATLRREAEDRADDQALDELKRRLGKKLLPEARPAVTFRDLTTAVPSVEAAS